MIGLSRTAIVASLVVLWLLAIFFVYDFGFSSAPLTTQVPSLLPDNLIYSLGKYDAYENPRAKPRLADFPVVEAHIALNWTFIDRPDNKWRTSNENTYRRLVSCMLDPSGRQCHGQWNKVIFMASGWMEHGILQNWKGGEGVWAKSMYNALARHGYSFLFAEESEDNMIEVVEIYRVVPEFIIGVFIKDLRCCYYQAICSKTVTNPTGIPVWKIFHLEYFPNVPGWGFETLAPAFQITAQVPLAWPNNSAGETYLGFSLDEECRHRRYLPQEARQHRIYIYGKKKEYFSPDRSLWPTEFFSRAKEEVGVDFNLGFQRPEVFAENVALSKLMLGLGGPRSSPSPWEARCQGVPFLNPIQNWNREEPDDCQQWQTQHDSMRCLTPPYVYNVRRNHWQGFREAIEAAISPAGAITPFIPDWMTQNAMDERMVRWAETSWYELGRQGLATWRERYAAGAFIIHDEYLPVPDWIM